MSVIMYMYFKELFWITNGICKNMWKKPYRQYDVLIAKVVLSIDLCKKSFMWPLFVSPYYFVILHVQSKAVHEWKGCNDLLTNFLD